MITWALLFFQSISGRFLNSWIPESQKVYKSQKVLKDGKSAEVLLWEKYVNNTETTMTHHALTSKPAMQSISFGRIYSQSMLLIDWLQKHI